MIEEKEKIAIILSNSFSGVKIELGNQERLMDSKTVIGIVDHLKEWLDWKVEWDHTVGYYKDFSKEKIEKDLNETEKKWEKYDEPLEDRFYSIGGNYAQYLDLRSNNEAEEKIKNDFNIEFPQFNNILEFDVEHSYCYIYTKDREVAEIFTWWTYNKYIKPILDEFK